MSIYKNGERYDVEITPSGMSANPTWDDIQNKPDFKPVATSGSYDDLTDKPEIPSVEGLASEQWVEEQGYLTEHQDISGKVDRSELAPVATSGSYDDLTDKPEIPAVGNGTITIKQGENEQSFTLNQSNNQTIDLEEGISDWNDIQNKPDFKPVATSGNYNDLTNKPDLSDVVRLSTTGGQIGVRVSTSGFTIDSDNRNIDFTYTSLKLDTPLWIRLTQAINLADGWTATLHGDEATKKRLVYNYRNDTTNNVQIPQYRTIGLILTASGSFHYIFSIGWVPTDITTSALSSETWTFTLSDGSTVNKNIVVK